MLRQTDFQFPYPFEYYQGKVRDVYNIEELYWVMVATDRISAFDVTFPELIPTKGQLLNQLSTFFFQKLPSTFPTHFIAAPHPNVTIAHKCIPYPVEVIVRGYLCGHAYRLYQQGQRVFGNITLPEGLQENDLLPEPILTPTTKSRIGHDIDITEQEITKSGLVPAEEWMQIRHMSLALYNWGKEYALSKGLILADTKFEFGYRDDNIYLIDEIFTPDSSRFFRAKDFIEENKQEHYSKEFLRQWLLSQGFQGQGEQPPPSLPQTVIQTIKDRYTYVFETLTGEKFIVQESSLLTEEIYHAIIAYLQEIL
ncbi:MAG: phosphoribosylaminoimidazolesuccinocarboxamide synthase [Bacteroidia bacterium]|nr:phosphoribosylaminoimidazolesuccinocarboxamide synthase [Bacteroidia bacterium]